MSGFRFVTTTSRPRGTTSGRATSECGAMNVTVIASMPHMRTGPLFDRLYAVEPDGVAWMIPSASTVPSGSPPIAHSSSDTRPTSDVAATTSLTATAEPPECSNSSVGSSITTVVAREHAPQARLQLGRLHRREEPEPAEVDADHRHSAGEVLVERAQHRPVAAEHDDEVGIVVGHLRAGLARDRSHALDRLVEAVALAEQDADPLYRLT